MDLFWIICMLNSIVSYAVLDNTVSLWAGIHYIRKQGCPISKSDFELQVDFKRYTVHMGRIFQMLISLFKSQFRKCRAVNRASDKQAMVSFALYVESIGWSFSYENHRLKWTLSAAP